MTPNRQPPLYERDPKAWAEHLAEGNRTQPCKRVAAEVLLHDKARRLLIVDPAYKPDWDIPGGMAEANESPADAARREIREELGLDLTEITLLCVDWVAPHGPWDDLLMFVFDGGVLDCGQVATVRPSDPEITAIGFYPYAQACGRLRDYVWRRTRAALAARESGCPVYTHNGYPL